MSRRGSACARPTAAPPTVGAVYRAGRRRGEGPAACFSGCPHCKAAHCVPVAPEQSGELVVTAPCCRSKFLRITITAGSGK